MILERAELPIQQGKEEEFAKVMHDEGMQILTNAKGCHSVRLGRGVENPDKFILLLEWDSVEDHVALTQTEEFGRFRELAGPFFAGAPAMEHFDMG